MPSPKRSVTFWDVPYGTSTTVAVGDVLIPTTDATAYLVATAANRGTRRSEGIAMTSFGGSGTGTVEIQAVGTIDATITGLGAGTASWVRCSSTGRPERFTPSGGGSSDIIGKCEADGRLHLEFGMWTEDLAVAAGGGFTAGGSNGDVMIKASSSSSTGVTGNNGDVLYKTGGAWTSTPAVQTPTGTGVVRVTGGTLNAAGSLGTALQVLRTNAGATDVEWAAASGGFTPPTGTGFVTVTSGSLDAAATTSFNVSTYTLTDTSIAQYDLLLADGTPRFKRFAKGGTSSVLTTSSGGVVQWGSVTPAMLQAGTNGQVLTTSGTTPTWATIVNANVSASAAIASTKIAPPGNSTEVIVNSGGTALGAATNVKAGSGFISIGSGTVNTVGLLRFAYSGGGQSVIIGLKDNGGTDRVGFAVGAGNIVQVGHNESNLNLYGNDVLLSGNSTTQINANSQFMFHGNGTNIGIFASATNVPASVTGVCYLKNASAAPTTLTSNPSGGGLLYSEAGAGKWQGTSGTRTTFGPADPHCKKCGRDFAHEWENVINNERLMVCVPCMLDAMSAIGIAVDDFAERRLKT